jgi:cytochrome c oxidase cbb3-type subunit 3
VRQEYDETQAALKEEQAKKALAGGQVSNDMLAAMSSNSTAVEKGKGVFTSTCAACHRADGGGNIGPNLTDGYWLHGGKPVDIYHCVHDGVPSKGMPTWGPQLGDEKVADVVAYVLTIKGTNVANGKAPQGEQEN